MRRVSRKHAAQLRRYTQLRRDFLDAQPRCGFPGGCVNAATEVHHKRGRVGDLLLDTNLWLGLCRAHHAWITEHPAAAYEMGVSERRTGAA